MGTLRISWRTENGRLASRWVESEVQEVEPSGLANRADRTARQREGNREYAVSVVRMLSLLLTAQGVAK